MALAARRPEPMTPEQEAAWTARKTVQWERIRDAFALPEGEAVTPSTLLVTLIRTRNAFVIRVQSGDGFDDEYCIGSPAHTVTRNDQLLTVPGRDASDRHVEALIAAWKARRRVTNADPLHGKGEPPR